MIEILYSPEFVRKYKKLPSSLQEEARTRIEEFQDVRNHKKLKVHKLRGELRGLNSFSVNYTFRIVFSWDTKNKTAHLQSIGDHSVYK
jgi:mRNA-degrading endonuclease YafQ of YafQ-DinJ toxin-antitoxin module